MSSFTLKLLGAGSLVIGCGLSMPCAVHAGLVDFDVYPDGSAVQRGTQFTDQWASLGVLFSDGGSGGPGPSANSCSISAPNHAAASGFIVAWFVDPCTGEPSMTNSAGMMQDWCWASGEGLDVYAYDAAGTQIGHQFSAGGGARVNFVFDTPMIARLDIFHIGQGIDNFSFNIPASVANSCPSDIVGDDETVNVDDLLAVINAWGICGLGICTGDVNCSGAVDVDDLLAVINAWGACE